MCSILEKMDVNENVISLIENCENYAELQTQLSKILSSGYFLLTKSKKQSFISSLNCREDIEASYHIDYASEGGDEKPNKGEEEVKGNKENIITEWHTKPTIDPILYISALPSPDLKQSQKYFKNSLSIIIQLCNKIHQIQNNINQLNQNNLKGDDDENVHVEDKE